MGPFIKRYLGEGHGVNTYIFLYVGGAVGAERVDIQFFCFCYPQLEVVHASLCEVGDGVLVT